MGGDTNVNYDKFFIDSEDVEMLSILKFSIEEKFKVEQKNGIEVMFRFSSGKKETKIFS